MLESSTEGDSTHLSNGERLWLSIRSVATYLFLWFGTYRINYEYVHAFAIKYIATYVAVVVDLIFKHFSQNISQKCTPLLLSGGISIRD